jgi:four helix bundle protein
MRLSEDLRERTKRFASGVIQLYVALPKRRKEIEILGNQLLRSGTSVAAHAREASRARSDTEFCSKLDGLLQEADESQLWLELLREDCAISDGQLTYLHAETEELLAIFATIVAKIRREMEKL